MTMPGPCEDEIDGVTRWVGLPRRVLKYARQGGNCNRLSGGIIWVHIGEVGGMRVHPGCNGMMTWLTYASRCYSRASTAADTRRPRQRGLAAVRPEHQSAARTSPCRAGDRAIPSGGITRPFGDERTSA